MNKKEALKDISGIVEHSRAHSKAHKADVASQTEFIKALAAIVAKEAPEFNSKMEEIKTHYEILISKEQELAEAEERTAEDLNDLGERFNVIYRISEEYQACQRKINDCRNKIERLRKDLEVDSLKGGAKKFKIEGDINRAIEAKKNAIDEAEDKIHEFIEAKEKYALFKVNRLQHAYKCIGSAIQKSVREYSEEVEILQKILSDDQEQVDSIIESGVSTEEELPAESAPIDNQE